MGFIFSSCANSESESSEKSKKANKNSKSEQRSDAYHQVPKSDFYAGSQNNAQTTSQNAQKDKLRAAAAAAAAGGGANSHQVSEYDRSINELMRLIKKFEDKLRVIEKNMAQQKTAVERYLAEGDKGAAKNAFDLKKYYEKYQRAMLDKVSTLQKQKAEIERHADDKDLTGVLRNAVDLMKRDEEASKLEDVFADYNEVKRNRDRINQLYGDIGLQSDAALTNEFEQYYAQFQNDNFANQAAAVATAAAIAQPQTGVQQNYYPQQQQYQPQAQQQYQPQAQQQYQPQAQQLDALME